jgi:putative hydrolase of the HAD superfamily
MDLKAVTFDLWETLLFESDGAGEKRTHARCTNLSRTLNKFGLNTSAAQITFALDETVSHLLKTWNEDRDVTHMDQLRFLVRFASNGEAELRTEWVQELSAAYISPLYELPPYINPGASKCLKWLKTQELRVGLICNTGLTPGFGLRNFLSDRRVAGFFDVMIFSDEVRIRKPNSEIFLLTAKQLGAKPSEIVHIGDNLKADVWGAKNAGFRALHLKCEEGHDKKAQDDPTSLVSRSRDLGKSIRKQDPDKTIASLDMAIEAIKELRQKK